MEEVPAMSYGLLGAHVNATVSGLAGTIKEWKPPLVVVLDHSDVWHSVKAASPETLFVGRLYVEHQPNFNDPDYGALGGARQHCKDVLPWAERMGETYAYWQGLNEPILQSPEAMERYARFEVERARIMHGKGFRVVVGSFSVGNPPDLAHWRSFLPALEAALQYDGALALHEYAWPKLTHKWPWYLLRHRKVYDGEPQHDWEGLPDHLKSLPLLITECGLDGLIERGDEPRGWKHLYKDTPNRYLQQLAWYDAELQKDPYVVGAAIYCLATPDPKWKSYDIWPGIAKALARHAKPIYRLTESLPDRPPDPPTETTDPVLTPTISWEMKTTYRPGPLVIAGALPRPGIELTITDPWGNANTVVSGSKPEHGEGGFEVLAPHGGVHTVTFLDQSFRVRARKRTTIVTFTESFEAVEPPDRPAPPDAGPVLPPDTDARWELVLERLDRIADNLRERL
jgi:hypothetical protein